MGGFGPYCFVHLDASASDLVPLGASLVIALTGSLSLAARHLSGVDR